MAHKDYYDILGVPRTASADELKRAYRKLAQQYHPDKGGNSERFKEVNEAYQVLSDPNKRQQYDQFGAAGVGSQGFGGGGRYEDIFRGGQGDMGGIGDIFESFFGQAFSQVQAEIQVKLTQALLGDTIQFQNNQGESIELVLPPGTQDGQGFRFAHKGMPYRGGRGDLIVVVRIQYPKRISKEQRALLEQLRDAGL
ncbi:MAG: DnaJ domain-containing protein [Patescibacteria group bacterium]